MTQWHRKLKGDLGLRAAGTALLAISFVCIRPVLHRHALDPAHWSPGVVIYALTTIGFLSASLGSATVMLGHHLFDRVEISERWQPRRGEPPRPKPYLGTWVTRQSIKTVYSLPRLPRRRDRHAPMLLDSAGFQVVDYIAKDPSCGFRTVWLASRYG